METTYAGRVRDASLSTCASGWMTAPVFRTRQGTTVSASGHTHRGTTPTFPNQIFAKAIASTVFVSAAFVSTVENADFGAVDGAFGGTIPGPHTWSPPV
jgi:hypothetical protein